MQTGNQELGGIAGEEATLGSHASLRTESWLGMPQSVSTNF